MTSSMLWGGMTQGENGTSIAAEFRAVVAQVFRLLARPNVSDFFPIVARFDLQGIERETKNVLQAIEQIFDFVIDRRMRKDGQAKVEGANKTTKSDFLHILLEYRHPDTGESTPLTQIKAIFMVIALFSVQYYHVFLFANEL